MDNREELPRLTKITKIMRFIGNFPLDLTQDLPRFTLNMRGGLPVGRLQRPLLPLYFSLLQKNIGDDLKQVFQQFLHDFQSILHWS